MERKRSEELFEEAKTLFPGGVNSPVRAFKSVHGAPLFIDHGEGCRITDVDGNTFIDFCCSWGPLILGHNNVQVQQAISQTLAKGTSFGTPTLKGNEIGKLILENHRFLDMIRFVSSGTEAVMSAIRLARGYTGKNKIIKFEGCYHGHVDSLLVKAGSGLVTFGISSSAGIPESLSAETIVLPLNDLQAVIDTLDKQDDIAAIIIEPVPANNGLLLQDTNFLVWLRKLCDDHKVLLIFDEVISGFRVGFEGAAGYYNIAPDLITFGKIVGGGMPVGAFGGREEIMRHVAPLGPVYQAGTLSANPVTLSAGIAVIKQLLEPGFYEEMEAKTQYFVKQIQDHCTSKNYNILLQSIGSIFWMSFSGERAITSEDIDAGSADIFKSLHAKLLDNGIYLGPSGYEVGFVSAAHSHEDLDAAAEIINQCLDEVFNA
ncbi:MAG: glutamate-1-semialdehyde 2,1-aminomutase [Saprospiraceae bacterium]|nr:glutamate-1-semialdehyde 2,1-aminomutase [Saprospiraceae bacterium]